MTDSVETIVIGAGAVGLAIGRALARAGKDVLILEAASNAGTVTSSRNSEVIHAGIYYPNESLKAKLCVRGKKLLYEFCESHNVAYQRLGKLIVATSPEQTTELARLMTLGPANSVDDLVLLDKTAVQNLEPAVHCHAAIHSPSTGIIDSHGLLLALEGEVSRHGGIVALNARFLSAASADGRGFRVAVADSKSGTHSSIESRQLINSAGHGAWGAARAIDGLPARCIPPQHLCKGSYFSYSGKSPFRRLIYPIPKPESLGIHAGLDLAGQLRFGPDAEWVETLDYHVDPARADTFYQAIRSYFPDLRDGALHPGFAGVRPKIQGPGDDPQDFVIQGRADHGIAGLVNLFGIESPGLTSCLAIANYVRDLLDQ